MSRTSWVVAAVAATIGLSGCVAGGEAQSPQDKAGVVATINGSDVGRVTLTDEAVERISLRTAPVRAGVGAARIVPFSAVLYDAAGKSWVYTNPSARTYVRAPIVVDHVTGNLAYLRSGPPIGTTVVTVGVAELLGVEYGVEGE